MRVTCWLEQLPNKVDLTSWISTVPCDHRKIIPIFGLMQGYQCLETRSNKWDGLRNRFEWHIVLTRSHASPTVTDLRPQESCDWLKREKWTANTGRKCANNCMEIWKQKQSGLVWDNLHPVASTYLPWQTVLMPRVFVTYSSWGTKDDHDIFVQEVQTPGYISVTNAQPSFVQVALMASAHLATAYFWSRWRGDGRNPQPGTNSIEIVYL